LAKFIFLTLPLLQDNDIWSLFSHDIFKAELIMVPSHSDMEGNEIADQLT
jgi:hypothetical protein